MSQHIFRQIFDDPAANDGIIRHDQHRDNRIDPATGRQPAGFSERGKRPDRTFFRHTSQCGLCHDHCVAKGQGQNDVDQQENSSAVLCRQIGESPDVSEPDRRACRRQYEADLPGKGTSFFFVFHFSSLSLFLFHGHLQLIFPHRLLFIQTGTSLSAKKPKVIFSITEFSL